MKIEILFLHKSDWLGKLIKKFSAGDKTHCAILIDGLLLADTSFGRSFGVRFIPWNKCDYDIISLDLKHTQYEEAVEWIRSHKGIKYDNLNNILWLVGKKSNGGKKLNCVESVVEFLCDIMYLPQFYYEENLSPTQLYHILESRCKNA